MIHPNLKLCLKCGKMKPLSDFYFYKFKGKPNGKPNGYYVSPCKKCKNKRRVEYKKANREKVRKQSYISTKKYRDKNRLRLRKEERIHKAEKKLKEELKNWCIVPPKILSDCTNHLEPCPWIRCRHHMIWAVWDRVKHKTNSQIVNYILKMPVTCVFDYTKTDHTLEDIAQVFGVTREMVRQNEEKALKKIKRVKKRRDKLVEFQDHKNRHPIDPSIYTTFDFLT